MEYSNPKIPEKINYSKDNPLKEFSLLLFGLVLVIIIFVSAAHLLAQNLAHLIPFSYEQKIAPTSLFIDTDDNLEITEESQQKQKYLTHLAEKLASQMDLPEDMHFTITAIDDESINAMATLNGMIFIHQGLLDFAESENELAFIVAHELAHIKHRHPIKALSSGVVIALTLSIITGSIDNDGAAAALLAGTTLTSHGFSRSQEEQADAIALNALYQHYGHVNGGEDFFKRMLKDQATADIFQFLNTHPGMQQRIDRVQLFAFENTINKTNKLLTLPDYLQP